MPVVQDARPNGAAPPPAAPTPPPPAPPERNIPGPKYTVTDEVSAGKAISALVLDDSLPLADPADLEGLEDDDDTPSRSGPERDDGAETPTVPTPDDKPPEEGPEEQPPAAAIQPPTSWPADAKADFAKLPPNLQRVVAERESQREALLTQRAQEAAETRKAAQAAQTAAADQGAAYLNELMRIRITVMPEVAQLEQTDWLRLQQENPNEYTRMSALRDALAQRMQFVDQAERAVQQRIQQQRAAVFLERQESERGELHKKVPELADPVRRESVRVDLVRYLHDAGFTDDELSQALDHRLVAVAYQGLQFAQAAAARREAETKRNNPTPQMQRPGSPGTRENATQARFRQSAQRLGRTNSVRDAGRLLALLE